MFSHPGIKDLITKFFYLKTHSSARDFQDVFAKTVPIKAVVLATTAVSRTSTIKHLTNIPVALSHLPGVQRRLSNPTQLWLRHLPGSLWPVDWECPWSSQWRSSQSSRIWEDAGRVGSIQDVSTSIHFITLINEWLGRKTVLTKKQVIVKLQQFDNYSKPRTWWGGPSSEGSGRGRVERRISATACIPQVVDCALNVIGERLLFCSQFYWTPPLFFDWIQAIATIHLQAL